MYISAFHINGFGIFNNAGGENLLPGISIFFGKNEAGKSTCLEFFRTMLTGYPDKSKAGRRSFEPLNGGRPGGSLTLQWREGEMRLARAPAAYGGLRLNSADGSVLHVDELTKMLGGIDRDAYRRVFGFSLDELEKWDKKDNESIRNALYGASFGPGLVPPGEVLAHLGREMGKIFKTRGTTQQLSGELAELEKLRLQIARLQKENAEYNTIAESLAGQKCLLAEIAAKREDLELERMRLERRQSIRQQWEQWNVVKSRLDKLPEPAPGFPEDAQARLARLSAEKSACQRDVAEARERLRQLQANADSINLNDALLGELPLLRSLAERKSGYRQATSQIPVLEDGSKRFEESLKSSLSLLGPGWSCERIRNTDRSIFTREGMEKQAAEMSEARLGHQAALGALTTANREVELAESAVRQAEELLARQPEPAAPLTGEERESLRASMARLEESRRLEPRRKLALENATHAFNRALEQVQVFGGGKAGENGAKLLDELLTQRDKTLAAAAEIQESLRISAEATKKAEAAESEAEGIRRKYEELRAAQREAGGATRASLEAKASALRSLRNLAASMSAEEERKKELEARITQEKTPSSIKNWALIGFAMVFLIGACGIFALHWFWGIQELDFGNGMSLPINLWAAYAALFCGVTLMAGGFSAYGPEQKRQKMEMARLLSRSETSSMHLAELAAQSRQLCAEAGVDDLDPIALDAMEMLLEREKERLFEDEHFARELAAMRGQMGEAAGLAARLAAEAREKSNSAQQARRNWHGLMQSLGVDNVPAPESASTLFARAEAARLAYENVLGAQHELDAFWEDLHLIEESITTMPAVEARLAASPEVMGLEEAVRQTLAGCQDADKAREKRLRCEADLAAARNEHERATKRQGQAYGLLEELAAKLAQARHKWAQCLDGLGMNADLDPETVRAAYKCMSECLAAEDSLHRSQAELRQARDELEALENPLRICLAKLQMEARIGSDGKPDWLGTLDKLLADAEEQARQSERLHGLHQSVAAQKDAVTAKEAALRQAENAEKEMLALGGCATADEFLAQAALRDNRRALAARLDDLEAVLAQAARGEPLPNFLASFRDENQDEQEKRLMEVKNGLAKLASEERESAARAGSLQARADMLATADELAALRQDECMLLESIRRAATRWSSLSLATVLLQRARHIFEKERQPRIIRMASEIFNNITDGRWRGLSLNLEDASLMVLPAQGEPVPPYNLSRGAQEQAYLAFRMAYIHEHAETREPLPVIMDEILVNFDPERASRTARELARLAGDGQQQILYFTCQPHIVDMLKEAASDASLFLVENGDIRAAF